LLSSSHHAGQSDFDNGSFAQFALQGYLAAKPLHGVFHDRQPQACSASLRIPGARGLYLKESLKYPILEFRRDPPARITDSQQDVIFGRCRLSTGIAEMVGRSYVQR